MGTGYNILSVLECGARWIQTVVGILRTLFLDANVTFFKIFIIKYNQIHDDAIR